VKLIATSEAAAAASEQAEGVASGRPPHWRFTPTANFGVKLNIVPRNGVEKGAQLSNN
jgi:hypothetical protein